jgi:hypothetical protein
MTTLNKYALVLSMLLPFVSTSLFAKPIIGFGMSQQSGGVALNKELALARANEFLAQQASIATFVYRRDGRKVSFVRFLKADLNNVKVARSETLKNNGVIVWLKADTQLPTYADEHCQPVTASLSPGNQGDGAILAMLDQGIPDLLKPALKKGREVKGVSYLRNLAVDKNWLGKYTITAEVCVAQLKVR